MIVRNQSQLDGKVYEMDLDVTPEQLKEYYKGDKYVQDAFPNLSAGEREFIMTGITPEQWTNMFGRRPK